MPQVLSVRVSLPLPFPPLDEKDAYGSRELQVDDGLARWEDAPPAHTSMSGIHFERASLSSTHTLLSESGTQWGQAAAEREWGHSLSAISTKENGTFRGMGVLFEVSQGEMGRPAWVDEIERASAGRAGRVQVCARLHTA